MSAPGDAPKSAPKIPLAQGAVIQVEQTVWDSRWKSSVVAMTDEQSDTADLQDGELG